MVSVVVSVDVGIERHLGRETAADRDVCPLKSRYGVVVPIPSGPPGKRVYVKSVTWVRIPPHPSIPLCVRRRVGSGFRPVPDLGCQFRVSLYSETAHSKPPPVSLAATRAPGVRLRSIGRRTSSRVTSPVTTEYPRPDDKVAQGGQRLRGLRSARVVEPVPARRDRSWKIVNGPPRYARRARVWQERRSWPALVHAPCGGNESSAVYLQCS